MKKILFLFLISTQITIGQTYAPFPTSNATWEEAFIGFIGSELETYNVMCGDTIIDGVTQSKVYQYNADGNGEIYGPYYSGSIYEDNMKIYKNPGNELLYDFTLEVGDTFPIFTSKHMVVESIGTTDVNGEARLTVFFEPYQDWYRDEFWIAGIGSNFGLFSRGMYGADFDPWTKCVKENETLLHNFDPAINNCDFTFTSEECDVLSGTFTVAKNDFSTTVSPNPFSEKTVISFGEKFIQNGELTIFNLNGQLLQTQQFSGSSIELERGNLTAGMFIFKIQNELGEISTGKILVQ